MTANQVRRALLTHFQQRWAMLPEVTAATHDGRRIERRIDMLMVRRMPRKPRELERLAVEIKVSRADFLSDVRQPEKQEPWRALAHRHAYAVPEGLVDVSEVPADSGLIVIGANLDYGFTSVKFARKCPVGNDPGPMPTVNLMDAFWRAARGEALRCGYGYRPPSEADPDELCAQIARLQHELLLAQGQVETARERVQEWRRRYALHDPPPCGTCGHPLRPDTGKGFLSGAWTHKDASVAAACTALRVAAQRAADVESTGREQSPWMYESGYGVPGPEPAPEVEPADTEVQSA